MVSQCPSDEVCTWASLHAVAVGQLKVSSRACSLIVKLANSSYSHAAFQKLLCLRTDCSVKSTAECSKKVRNKHFANCTTDGMLNFNAENTGSNAMTNILDL